MRVYHIFPAKQWWKMKSYRNEDFTDLTCQDSGLNLAGINYNSIVDGDGVRLVLFFSGCKHNCTGCHNKQAQNFECGIQFSRVLQEKVIEYVRSTSFIKGFTLSGGDPMYSAELLIPFVQRVRSEVPNADVWIYSGFTYEQIQRDEQRFKLLSLCDILVDGEFVLDQKDESLKFRGSRNQRVIDIQKSKQEGKVVLLE